MKLMIASTSQPHLGQAAYSSMSFEAIVIFMTFSFSRGPLDTTAA